MKKIALFVVLFTACSLYLKAQDSLQNYVGKYKFPEGSFVLEGEVKLENDVLNLVSDRGTAQLDRVAADTFALTAYNGTVIFKRNEAKKIIGIKIEVMGMLLEGTKEEKNNIDNLNGNPLPVNKSTFPIKYLSADLLLTSED